MPSLTWASKTIPPPLPASLELESVFYPQGAGYPDSPPTNHLILGDNLAAMSALLPEYEGRIDLIYADPPFFTNKRYPARIGQGEDSRKPQEWQLAEGYPDAWPDLDAYLDMLYPRLALMYRLLAPTGTLYLHLDWHADAYARLLLDEIFGSERLLNQVIWVYHGPSPIRSAFNRKHDTILVYTKSDQYTFNADAVRQPYDPVTVKTFASSPKAGFGKVPNLERGKVPEDWWYFPVIARLHNERTGYPTQKPAALLERILLASSNPGDLVADFFCGSGTAAVVAVRLGRRFLAGDITFRAVHTTRSRLVTLPAPPFALHQVALPGSAPLPAPSQPSGFSLQLSDRTLSLHTGQVDELDYWEVDPAYDGKVFRSAAQAVRPRKKAPIATSLTLPVAPREDPVCVRLVDIQGKVTYETLRPRTHLPLR
jgi:DNA modification methylase